MVTRYLSEGLQSRTNYGNRLGGSSGATLQVGGTSFLIHFHRVVFVFAMSWPQNCHRLLPTLENMYVTPNIFGVEKSQEQ